MVPLYGLPLYFAGLSDVLTVCNFRLSMRTFPIHETYIVVDYRLKVRLLCDMVQVHITEAVTVQACGPV